MTLVLTVKIPLRQRVDMAPLIPELLQGKSTAEIGNIQLQSGNGFLSTGDIFLIEGQADTSLTIRGESAKLDYIGRGMKEGEILVEGHAGSYAAMQMRGGRLTVNGNIDAYGACEMKNGTIIIKGNAGDFLGAALPGNKKGMSGGLVVVKGNAGDRAGDHLRRGSILIEGNAGDYLGSRMTAGTIGLMGKAGPHLGYGMGRGTLLLVQTPESIPATFNDCGPHTLSFLPLLLKSYSKTDTRFAELAGSLSRVRRYAGDMSSIGKGEILVAI